MRAGYAIALFAVACDRGVLLEIPFGPDDQSAVLVVAQDVSLSAYAIARGDEETTTIPMDGRLFVLLYARTLADLDFEPGRIDRAQDDEESRALPAFRLTHLYLQSDASGWDELDTAVPPAEVLAFRAKALTGEQCLAVGCFSIEAVDLENVRGCQTPCPAPPMPAEPMAPMLPVEPEPPSIAVCSGDVWAELCTRTASIARTACPRGEVFFPGGTACEPVGACASTFPTDVPVGTLFVDADGAIEGDGSRATPFKTLARALLDATEGTTILARGVFRENVDLPTAVTLRGLCAEDTQIIATSSVVRVRGTDVQIENLSIIAEGGGPALIVDGRSSPVSAVLGALILASPVDVLRIVGASATLEGERISILPATATTSPSRAGVRVERGAEVTLRALTIAARRDSGLVLTSNSRVAIDGFLFFGNRGPSRSTGIRVDTGADLDGHALEVLGSRGPALVVSAAHATVRDAYFHNNGGGGVSIELAEVEGARWRIERGSQGLSAAQGTYHLEDIVIRQMIDYDVNVRGGTISIDRARIERTSERGIHVETSSLTLTNVIEEGSSNANDYSGFVEAAIRIDRSRARLARIHLSAHPADGISVDDSVVVASDVRADRIAFAPPDGYFAPTIALYPRTRATLSRIAMDQLFTGAIFLNNAHASISDLTIHDSSLTGVDGTAAIQLTEHSMLELSRARIAGARTYGYSQHDSSSIISDLTVDDSDGDNRASAFVVVRGTSVLDRAAFIADVKAFAIDGATAMFRDVRVEAQLMLSLDNDAEVIAERVAYRGLDGILIHTGSKLELRDFYFDRRSVRAMDETEHITVNADGTLSLDRFWLSGSQGSVGIYARLSSIISFSRGKISGTTLGISFEGDLDPRTVLDRVDLSENVQEFQTR